MKGSMDDKKTKEAALDAAIDREERQAKYQSAVEIAERKIVHRTDGPVTGFVMLMRAMREVAAGADPEVMGHAVANQLAYAGIDLDDPRTTF